MGKASPPPEQPNIPRPNTAASSRKTSFKASSARASSCGDGQEETFVISLLQGKGTGVEIGIAAVSLNTGKTILTQVADTSTFTRTLRHLHLHKPLAIIMPEGSTSNGESQTSLSVVLENEFPVEIYTVDRQVWNADEGLHYIKLLAVEDRFRPSTLMSVSDQYYALAATSSVFHWLSKKSMVFSPRTLPIRYTAMQGTMFIDAQTAKDLELVTNVLSQKTNHTLYKTLNHCSTPMGSRLLRANILQPFNEKAIIEHRLEAIQDCFFPKIDLDNVLAQFSQKDTIPARQRDSEGQITLLLGLKTALAAIRSVQDCLAGSESVLLQNLHNNLVNDAVISIEDIIKQQLNEKQPHHNRGAGRGLLGKTDRLFAVKTGVEPLLDVARTAYSDTRMDINDMAKTISEVRGINCTPMWTTSGFRFSMARTDDDQPLPQEFLNKDPTKKNVTFATRELQIANGRLRQSEEEIFSLSRRVICGLEDAVVERCGALYSCAEALAVIDVIAGLAHATAENPSWVRPEFSEILAIHNGKHPMLEFRLGRDCISNNTYAATGVSNFQIIQGPNMSGKSTYLRQIGLMTIQAMVGCHVPAEHANFKLHDALLTRLSNDDSMEKSLSTFAAEMASAAVILGLATEKSLVLIDELGRGTAPQEGIGLSFAIAEELVRLKPFVFFATHFADLAALLMPLQGVVNLHLSVENVRVEGNDNEFKTAFKYKVLEGPCPEEHYGLETAKLASLPESVLRRATDVAARLSDIEQNGRNANPVNAIAARRKILLELRAKLKQAVESSKSSDAALARYLRQLQDESLRSLSKALQAEKKM